MIQGFIEKIEVKNLSFGPIHNFTVSGTLYDIGKFPLKGYQVGDYVQFDATNKPGTSFWKLTHGTLKKLDKPAGVAAPAKQAASVAYTGGKSSDTQKTISRQAAANTAIAYVKLLVDADALPVPKSAKSDKKADLIEAILVDYMNKFHNWSVHENFDFGEPAEGLSDLNLSDLEDKETWSE